MSNSTPEISVQERLEIIEILESIDWGELRGHHPIVQNMAVDLNHIELLNKVKMRTQKTLDHKGFSMYTSSNEFDKDFKLYLRTAFG